jgi:regulator of sigma E protease
MLIILIVIIGLSLLILGHEAGHFFAAKAFGLKIDEFGFGFPPRITAWKRGDTEYSLNWLPFGGFVKIGGEHGEFEMFDGDGSPKKEAVDDSKMLYAQPAWKKSVIMLAGVFMNFILGWIFLSIVLMVGAPQALVIAGIEPGSPAAQAGIMANDIVKGYTSAQSFIDFIDSHEGTPVQVAVVRNDKEIDFTVTPRTNVTPNEGALGVELQETGEPREGFFASARDGFLDAGILLWITAQAFGQLIAQLFVHASLLPGVVGPVGIFGLAEETGKIGLVYLLQLLGIISLNLTIVNLIPFPALDGGRFVMAIIEKIKGSPLSPKIEGWINGIGFAFLLTLMVLLTVRDVGNLL